MKQFRQQQTVRDLRRLRTELDDWISHRVAGAQRQRFDSQIHTIGAEIREAAAAVASLLDGDLAGRSLGEVCAEYNGHDQRIAWVRYVWDYFREKLDQRDDATLRAALESADEVLWSCYRPYYESSSASAPPPPIACISYDYTPIALRTQSGHVLDRRVDQLAGPLKDYFRTLPVGVLRLPPSLVTAPWSLALIGHETGHFLQDVIDASFVPGARFADRVQAAARQSGAGGDEAQLWRVWSAEIFADWIGVLTMGPWLIWALAPLILAGEAEMLTRQRAYPAPLIRLLMIARMSANLGLEGGDALCRRLGAVPEAATTPESRRDLSAAMAVAELVKPPAAAGQTELHEMLGLRAADFAPGGEVEQWAERLLGAGSPRPARDLRAARLIAAGASRAHCQMVDSARNADLDAELAALAAQVTGLIPRCRAPVSPETREFGLPLAVDFAPRAPSRLAQLVLEVTDAELRS